MKIEDGGHEMIGSTSKEGEVEGQSRRFNSIAAIFGICMTLAFLVLPFVYADRAFSFWQGMFQVVVWFGFSSSWIYLGYLVEQAGGGFGFVYSAKGGPRKYGSKKEILVFLFLFVSFTYGYLYIAHENTGYIGFNFIALFIVAGFSTHLFPLWLVGIFIVLQTLGWSLLGHLMWGGWMRIDELMQAFSGFVFSVMMFHLFKRERASRYHAVALSHDLDTANEQLRERNAQVEELASTRERNRIAREIHDTLGHSLTVVNMQLETAKALLVEDTEKAAIFLEKAQTVTKQGLSDIRSSVASLRSSPLDGKTLEQGLKHLLDDIRVSGILAVFTLQGEPRSLPQRVESALYRTAQEGLTNVRKHAKAERVELTIDYSDPERVTMRLKDDGVGCDNMNGGFGIMGIRERIQLLNGEVEIYSARGRGLELNVTVQS